MNEQKAVDAIRHSLSRHNRTYDFDTIEIKLMPSATASSPYIDNVSLYLDHTCVYYTNSTPLCLEILDRLESIIERQGDKGMVFIDALMYPEKLSEF